MSESNPQKRKPEERATETETKKAKQEFGYMVLSPDFTWNGVSFKVGEVTVHQEVRGLRLGEEGLHFHKKPVSCLLTYNPTDLPDWRYAKVRAVGVVIESEYEDQLVTDKLEIVEEIPSSAFKEMCTGEATVYGAYLEDRHELHESRLYIKGELVLTTAFEFERPTTTRFEADTMCEMRRLPSGMWTRTVYRPDTTVRVQFRETFDASWKRIRCELDE